MKQAPPSARPRVLIAADAVVPTGFARVVESIFQHLIDEFEIHQLGVGYNGDPHSWPWPIYPAGQAGDDLWGAHRIGSLAEGLKPDLIFLLSDTWIVQRWLAALDDAGCAAKKVAYVPVDAGPVDHRSVLGFDRLDQLFTYSNYAQRQLTRSLQAVGAKRSDFRAPEVGVIPHGVNSDTYHPVDRDEARARIFPNTPELSDAFIALNANRNQPRKRIDLTVLGFAEFARDKPDARLFLHMGSRDLGWDVAEMVRRIGIDHKTIMSTEGESMPNVSATHLNLIYNACDVGLNTAEAEGWGLTSHEHAATRAAQIVPDHTVYADLWGDAAIRVPPSFQTLEPTSLCDQRLVAPKDVAAALEICYRDRAYLNEMSQRAFHWALKPEHSWQRLAARWKKIFYQALRF